MSWHLSLVSTFLYPPSFHLNFDFISLPLCSPHFRSRSFATAHNTFTNLSATNNSFFVMNLTMFLAFLIIAFVCVVSAVVSYSCSSPLFPQTNSLPVPHQWNPRPWPTMRPLFLPLRTRSILLCSQLNGNSHMRFLPRDLHINL